MLTQKNGLSCNAIFGIRIDVLCTDCIQCYERLKPVLLPCATIFIMRCAFPILQRDHYGCDP